MTKEEAKKELSKMIFELGFEDNVDDKVYALNMAIQALSQEPTDENLHREREQAYMQGYEDASKRFRQEPTFDDECQKDLDEAWEQIQKKRKRIPITQKSGKWIPVSERLPEDRDWYLGIFKETDTGWINPLPFICEYVGTKTKFTTEDFWIIRCGSDREDDSGDYYSSLRCVAWMPLPKPYEPQESEE